jgi:KEOPS complex subunit Cgi121
MRVVTGTPTVGVETLLDDLDGVTTTHPVAAQAVDARHVVDRAHLDRAVELADRERAAGDAIARDRAVEFLLYAAGRRQIDRALAMGASEGAPTAVVVAAEPGTEDASGAEAAAVEAVTALDGLDPHPVEFGDPATLRAFFGVSDAELDAAGGDLAGLVHERVALLVVER